MEEISYRRYAAALNELEHCTGNSSPITLYYKFISDYTSGYQFQLLTLLTDFSKGYNVKKEE